MGLALALAGHTSLTVKLTTRFRCQVPLGTVALIHALPPTLRAGTAHTKAILQHGDGTILAESEALFMHVNSEAPHS